MWIFDTFVCFYINNDMDFLDYQFNTVGFYFAIILGIIILFQILYYFIVYGRVAFFKDNKLTTDEKQKYIPSVSVVMCVKDDAYNLEKKLPIILEQEYPNFEVVVVNDASKDETEYVLRVLQEIYPNLNVVNLYNNVNGFLGKKYPLSLGIKSAKNEIILLTESDTMPLNYNWITTMVKGFKQKKDIVLGFTNFEQKPTFLNTLMHYENLTSAMNYLGNAMLNNPFMGQGRNMAYKREFFFETGGFISQYNISVGEDDLFINKNANSKNTSVIINKESINLASPKEKREEWVIQKKKHFKSMYHFKLKDKIISTLMPFATLLIYVLVALSIVFQFPWQYAILPLVLKYTFQIIVYYKSSKTLATKQVAFLSPLLEVLFLFINTTIRFFTLFTKKI
ncbi:MAG: glycosyltransferase [Bacteroidales bacterium]|nr:glycosyltransferase [Bacteroidales bacterium]MDY4789833.1 glycosyltransferase [Bacteroidales bacterium]NCC19263.1 glycosyltransferase [Bacteroidia bacterium]